MSAPQVQSKPSRRTRKQSGASPWGATRRRRDTQFTEKREALLMTAAKLFRERGYESTSLNDVADALNITKPTLYYYVKSKDQLVAEIVSRAQSDLLHFMRKTELSEGTAFEKLRAIMIDYLLTVGASDYGACFALLSSRHFESKTLADVNRNIREADEILYRILSSGQKDGSIVVHDRTIVMHAMFGSLSWAPKWYKPDGRLAPEKFATAFVDTLLNGVKPREAKSGRGRS